MKKHLTRTLSAVLCALLLIPFSVQPLTAAANVSQKMEDYTGAGTVIAVIDTGFDVTSHVFSGMPKEARLGKSHVSRLLGAAYAAGYVSEKIPLAWDYAAPLEAEDAARGNVSHISDGGTSAAALAAGCYRGAGETVNEDGTVTLDGDYLGTAPDAQLLLMKAARGMTSILLPEAVAAAISDALTLQADVILLNPENLTVTEEVLSAIGEAEANGVPILMGAGDLSTEIQRRMKDIPAALIHRGTLSDLTAEAGVYRIGAAADPFAHIVSFTHGETEISYIDSSLLYLGKSFAEVFAGQKVTVVPVPGVGAPADYEGVEAEGKIAVVKRGEIPFAEKAQAAADAGALGMIVIDNGGGLVQMALEGTEIPAVIISDTAGAALLTEGASDEITLAAAKPGAASFSARGVTGDFSAALTLVTAGENVRCPKGDSYVYRSGTALAAARAAGYCARTIEYMKKAGVSHASPVLLLAAAASPLINEAGEPLPTREVGAGTLTGEEVFPAVVPVAKSGRAVSALSWGETDGCTVEFTLTNAGKSPVTYTLTAAFTTDTVDENGRLTGGFETAAGVSVTLSGEKDTVTVPAGKTVTVTAEATLSAGEAEKLSKKSPYGFFLDGVITLTAGDTDEAVHHPVTLFWGDPDLSPLADLSVYEDGEAYLAPLYLSVRDERAGTSSRIGAVDPAAETLLWDEDYNFVNPASMRAGGLEIFVPALREIDSARVRVRDEDGRILYENETGAIPRYLISGGYTVISAGSFAGTDDPDALFPEGTYTVELRLFAGGRTEDITIPVRVDATRPEIGEVTLTAATEDTLTFSVKVKDNGALRGVWAYDLTTEYETVLCGGKTEDTCTVTVEGYDGESPLYFEVIDLAGLYRAVRFTAPEIAAMTAAQP